MCGVLSTMCAIKTVISNVRPIGPKQTVQSSITGQGLSKIEPEVGLSSLW